MENFPVVSSNGPWYELFYNLALLFTLLILLYEGYQRKFPILKWILLVLSTRLMFIAGTKIFTFSLQDWNMLFTYFELPEANGKSLIGGLLMGGLALFGGYRLFNFKQNIADAFALILPIGIAIQRVGCFTAGCCFGKVCYLPWAVKYPAQTLPHYHQFNDHLITYGDNLSLPVHPVQIYEIIGLLLVLVILIRIGKRLKAPGNLFLLSMILVFTVRIIIEFFRSPDAHTIGGEMIGVFNTTQLFLLPLILLFIFLLRKRERKTKFVSPIPIIQGPDISFIPAMLLLSLNFFIFWRLKAWFDFPEATALWIVFVVSFGIFGYHYFVKAKSSFYYRLYPAFFILPLFLMAQTSPYSYQQDSVYIQRFKSLKVGFASGEYLNSHTIGQGEGCDRVSNTEYFKQKYSLAGVGVEFTEQYPNNDQFKYGVDAILGSHREVRISDNHTKTIHIFDISPYVSWDQNWFGIGGGVHVGNVSYFTENLNVDGTSYPNSGSKVLPVYPRVFVRFGPRRWLYLDYRLASQFPSALPGFRHQIGFGTGLGMRNGTALRWGNNVGDINYLSGYIPLENKIILEPMLLWGNSAMYETNKKYYQFSLGVSYQFGFNEARKARKY